MSGRWMRAPSPGLVLLGAALAFTTPGHALGDLTGTYAGKLTCRGLRDGLGKVRFQSTGPMSVSQDAADRVWVSLPDVFGVLSEVRYRGVVAASDRSERQGEIAFASCFNGFTADPAGSLTGEVARARVVARPGSDRATVKGDVRLFLHDTNGAGAVAEVYTCKLRYQRIDLADPGIDDCS